MAIIKVATQSQLDTAVKNVKSGDTILLAAGAKFTQLLFDNKAMASTVTIKSASTTNPATIGYVTAKNSSNVVFQNLNIGRAMTPGVDQDWTNMALVQNSKNVTFDSIKFFSTGSNDNYLGRGIFNRDSSNIVVKNSDFSHLSVGMQSMSVSNITVQGNKFHDLRIDGAEFTAIKGALVDSNYFTDFTSKTDFHPDAIQFWTAGTKQASTDVVISNNVILPGTGNGSQGIFVQDEVGGIPYERITIKNNLLLDAGNLYNGITVRGGKDITIEGNTVLSPTTDSKYFYIRVENVTGGVVKNNLSDQLTQTNNSNVSYSSNVFLNAQKSYAANIKGINSGGTATIDSLIVSGIGYQKPITFDASFFGVAGATSTTTTTTTGSLNTKTTVTETVPVITTPSTSAPLVSAAVSTTTGSTSTSSTATAYTLPTTFDFSSLSDLLTPITATPVAKAAVPIISVGGGTTTSSSTASAAVVAPVATTSTTPVAAAALTSTSSAIATPVVATAFNISNLSKYLAAASFRFNL
jgi:hypothetical protein